MDSFQKIERKSVSDQVFDILKDYIVSGKLTVGEKIPSENELSKMLGVSRPSVKAAVERLRAMGLLEVRVGDGSYVKEFSTDEYIENWAGFVMSDKDMSELLEFRGRLELDCLDLAIDRATDEDLEVLRDLSDKLVDAYKHKDYERGAKYDMDFHHKICRCTGNKYFSMMYELTGDLIFKQVQKLARDVYESDASKFLFDDHKQIYQAMRDRDKERGRELLTKHILNRDSHLESLTKAV